MLRSPMNSGATTVPFRYRERLHATMKCVFPRPAQRARQLTSTRLHSSPMEGTQRGCDGGERLAHGNQSASRPRRHVERPKKLSNRHMIAQPARVVSLVSCLRIRLEARHFKASLGLIRAGHWTSSWQIARIWQRPLRGRADKLEIELELPMK